MVPGSSAPSGSAPQFFSGSALRGFTASDTVHTAGGVGTTFTQGMTMLLLLEHTATPANTQTILAAYSNTDGTYTGWELSVGPTNELVLTSDTNAAAPVTLTQGFLCLCIVWVAATGHVWIGVNGAPLLDFGSLAAQTAASGLTAFYVGTAPPPLADLGLRFALAPDRILAFATFASEFSTATAQASTCTTGNRFDLTASVVSSAAIYFSAAKHFSPMGFPTGGSTPLTFSVAGTPSLVAVAEQRYGAALLPYWLGSYRVPRTGADGLPYDVRGPLDMVRLVTDATRVGVELYADWNVVELLGAASAVIGVYVGGAFSSEFQAGGLRTIGDVQLGAGAAKAVQLWTGPTFVASIADYGNHSGTYISAVRLPYLLTDGVTPAGSRMVVPTRSANRLLIFTGGHELIGQDPGGTLPTQGGITHNDLPARLRVDFNGSVMAYDADQIFQLGSTQDHANATAAMAAAFLSGATAQTVWIAAGIQDWFDVNGVSFGWSNAADYQVNLARLVDAIRAACPTALIIKSTAVQTIAPHPESTTNSFGETLPPFRTADTAVVAARSSWMVLDDWSAGAVIANADISTDGFHLVATAWPKMHDRIKSILAGIGGRGY